MFHFLWQCCWRRGSFLTALRESVIFDLWEFLDLLNKAKNLRQDGTESSATGTDNGYGHYDQYEKDSDLRNRFHASRSQPSMDTEMTADGGRLYLLSLIKC